MGRACLQNARAQSACRPIFLFAFIDTSPSRATPRNSTRRPRVTNNRLRRLTPRFPPPVTNRLGTRDDVPRCSLRGARGTAAARDLPGAVVPRGRRRGRRRPRRRRRAAGTAQAASCSVGGGRRLGPHLRHLLGHLQPQRAHRRAHDSFARPTRRWRPPCPTSSSSCTSPAPSPAPPGAADARRRRRQFRRLRQSDAPQRAAGGGRGGRGGRRGAAAGGVVAGGGAADGDDVLHASTAMLAPLFWYTGQPANQLNTYGNRFDGAPLPAALRRRDRHGWAGLMLDNNPSPSAPRAHPRPLRLATALGNALAGWGEVTQFRRDQRSSVRSCRRRRGNRASDVRLPALGSRLAGAGVLYC